MMDRTEFDAYIGSQSKLTRQQAEALWHILDRDGSGQVEKAEFQEAMLKMQKVRAWMRYCPTCSYSKSCSYCLECNTECDK